MTAQNRTVQAWTVSGPCRYPHPHSCPGPEVQAATAAAKSLQSCPTLCDPRDDSPPGSPVPGILQARTLEWVAISFSKKFKGPSEKTWPPDHGYLLSFSSIPSDPLFHPRRLWVRGRSAKPCHPTHIPSMCGAFSLFLDLSG